ncbi:hypothetical protein [Streptosporangium sp. KLBMP 9127]|nr:hypothetical protein [Streptosporangium sp. KLBMP 9127]
MGNRPTSYQVVEAVVARLDSEELPYLGEIWVTYIHTPDNQRRARESMLGSGLEPQIVEWATVVVTLLGGILLDAVKDELNEQVRGRMKPLFTLIGRRRAGKKAVQALQEAPVPVMDPETCTRLAETVRVKALTIWNDPERAVLLSDAVLGELLRAQEYKTAPDGSDDATPGSA